ncbi:MAG TPA: hypothetical protein DHU96_30970 [Actinobacteria bacterium]|nr:hypothetical protein [Actinomycetota bacterium]
MPPPAPHHDRGALAGLPRLLLALVHPVVLTFVIGAVFSYLSGDTFRAAYLLVIGLALVWDHARRRVPQPHAAAAGNGSGSPERGTVFSHDSADLRRAAMRRLLIPAVIAAVAFSAIVGLFQRYSWPATILVAAPAIAGVLVAWWVSAGSQHEPGRLSAVGVAAWAFVWVGASVWELTALFLQPTLHTDSYAHPTLSYLANAVLGSAPGRSAVLFSWLAFGWYLARR